MRFLAGNALKCVWGRGSAPDAGGAYSAPTAWERCKRLIGASSVEKKSDLGYQNSEL